MSRDALPSDYKSLRLDFAGFCWVLEIIQAGSFFEESTEKIRHMCGNLWA